MLKTCLRQCYCIFLILSNFQDIVETASEASNMLQERSSLALCGFDNEIIELSKYGEASSISVMLSPIGIKSVCKLRVIAPKTHVINIQFVETKFEMRTTANRSLQQQPCVMSIFLPENSRSPVWKGDPCSQNSLAEIDLLTPDLKILWMPPSNSSYVRDRKLVLTAVGQGAICKEPHQHTCMKIGWEPMLCISDHLVCDGIKNCPKSPSTSDEDESLCRSDILVQNTWRQLAVEFFKRKWRDNNKLLQPLSNPSEKNSNYVLTSIDQSLEMKTTKKNFTIKPEAAKPSDTLSQVLSKYGPWGYLMLGMLICGTVLLFCGLWECCIKKPKTPVEAPLQVQQPTTVLIINNTNESQVEDNNELPNYEDLDLPPSYVALFPNYFKQTQNISFNNNRSRDCGSDDDCVDENPSSNCTTSASNDI